MDRQEPFTTSGETTVNRRGGAKKIVASIAGAVMSLGALGGVAGCSPEAPRPSATATAAPGGEASPSTTPSASETASATPTAAETSTDPDTEAVIAALEKASPEAFEKLPLDSRLTWVLAKYKLTSDELYFSRFLNQKTFEGDSLGAHNPIETPLGADANGQAIVDQFLFGMQLRQAWQPNVQSEGNGPLDQKTAEKLISGMILDPKSAAYKDHVDTVKNSTEAGRIGDKDVAGYRCVNTELGDDITLEDGTKAPTKTIILSTNGQTWKDVFVFVERPELGPKKGVWLLVSEKQQKA